MLDIKLIRNEPDRVREALRRRGAQAEAALDKLLELDRSRRETLVAVEKLRGRRNAASEEIARLKRDGIDPKDKIEAMRRVGDEIKRLEAGLKEVETALEEELLQVPNLPDPAAPDGGEDDSVVLHHWGIPRKFTFEPEDHLDLAVAHDLIDMERGARTSGSRFAYLKGDLVFLQFALVQFALQKLAAKGFRPVLVPVLVRDEAMYGTGFFPTDMQQVYRVEADGLNLVGTSEVPLAALHMDEIVDEAGLPVHYVGYSTCFRREAGAAGKDTRGLVRLHQFDKVEMVKIVRPETSYDELETLLACAEAVLQELELPYRVLTLASGDLSFSAAKCYDLETWAPAEARWLEVSSCSNFEAFQARRLGLRYRTADKRLEFPHTLNGSGLALPRVIVSLLEVHQTERGTVRIPAALRPYLDGLEELGPGPA